METNYYFDSSNGSFYEALDRFVDLLNFPIFSKDFADKEKNAVFNNILSFYLVIYIGR